MTYRIGVDIGGTFTDFALVDDATGHLIVHKQLTTPTDPSKSVLSGIITMLEENSIPITEISAIAHGTTLVTNAVVERRGATTGMLVTAGFKDALDIAMERRFDLFDLRLEFAEPVVPRRMRVEISERNLFDGSTESHLDETEVEAAVESLIERYDIQALAICFLHSYVDNTHEKHAKELILTKFPHLSVSASSEVLPFMREYERWSTTTINAYVQPLTDLYLGNLEAGLQELGFSGRLLIMTSSGGMVTTEIARTFPVRLIESGPAAGALMAAFLGQRLGEPNLLSFDMGGTTAKGALIRNGKPLRRYEFEVAREYDFNQGSGLPLRIPVIDMIEIGAGGGSIAEVNDSNLLAVGPQSAGANPGPACYDQGGTSPTLTDANLMLGYLVADTFLGGRMSLLESHSRKAIKRSISEVLDIDASRAAWGIHEVINEDVARAFRVHASEVGFDYRNSAMIAFGGSGPAHAMRVAKKLRIPKVIFPVGAGVMSAIGLLTTPISYATLRSSRISLDQLKPSTIELEFSSIEKQARELLKKAGVKVPEIEIERRLDMRFVGQGHEVEVSLAENIDIKELEILFRETYNKVFAAAPRDADIEVINWKIEASGPRPTFADKYTPFQGAKKGTLELRKIETYDDKTGESSISPVVDRYVLEIGQKVQGPALIQEEETTTVLAIGDEITVDDLGNLVAEIKYTGV